MISIEIAKYFQSGLILILSLLGVILYHQWQTENACSVIHRNKTNFPLLYIACAILCVVIGFRPLSSRYFGDTVNYAYSYFNVTTLILPDFTPGEGDWLFYWISLTCYALGMDISWFFTLIMFGYVFCALIGIQRLFRNNTYAAMLCFLGAFSFFSYATNGIRNGLATSVVILAIALSATKKKNYILTLILFYAAFSLHKSTILPILSFVAASTVRNYKFFLIFWVSSIVLFLVASSPVENLFTQLGFDDRLSSYIEGSEAYAQQYKSGFRLDFLIYSSMPIYLGYHVIETRGIKNRTYELLLNTYILSNSFWVMLMGAAFSNRFAYLSWFLYPIVMAYPCCRMNVWNDRQGKIGGAIILANILFTTFMTFVYYG